MIFETNKDKGRAGLALAIAYFGANGYSVSIPLNDTQWYDLIVEKDGKLYTVQCKATASADGNIRLKSSGGTNGSVYDSLINHPALDFLFCINQNGTMFLIPFKDILENGNTSTIALREQPKNICANKNTFDTYPYIVTL